jgi:cytochrome c biogenesis protein CcdA
MSIKDIYNWLINADLLKGLKLTGSIIVLILLLALILSVIYLIGSGVLFLGNIAVDNFDWKSIGKWLFIVICGLVILALTALLVLSVKEEFDRFKIFKPFSSEDRKRYKSLTLSIEKRKPLGYDVSLQLDELKQLNDKYRLN